jgi:hypothetical protein
MASSENFFEINRQYQRDKLTDLIGNPPGWLLHSGLGILAFIVFILLWITWFINIQI